MLNWKKILFSFCATVLAPVLYYYLAHHFPGIPLDLNTLADLLFFTICLIFGISASSSAVTEYRLKKKR